MSNGILSPVTSKGILSIEGRYYSNMEGRGREYPRAPYAENERDRLYSKKATLVRIGDGKLQKLSTIDIKDAIKHMLRTYEIPTLMFHAHGSKDEHSHDVKLDFDDIGVTSSELLSWIGEHSKNNPAVDCAFFTCYGGAAFNAMHYLPPNSCMISLCTADEAVKAEAINNFHYAMSRAQGEFSLENTFIDYLQQSYPKTSSPMIGMPSRGVIEVPRLELNRGMASRMELAGRVADFLS
jgi:hypothetical protein